MARIFLVLAALLALAVPASAREPQLSALARIEPARTSIAQPSAFVTEVTLGLSQPVPFRAFLLDSPPRLVVDFREVDFSAANPKDYAQKGLLGEIRWGAFRPGWSRFVAELTGPVRLVSAEERTGETPNLHLVLERVEATEFVARDGAAQSALWDLPQPAPTAKPHRRQDGSAPLRVVLDPGHGGLDPGAEADGYSEAVLVLTFARELKEALTRAGIEVKMTREENIFVPLDTRLTVAHDFEADLFLSLHADALPEGEAMGATVYLFDETASDSAAQKLAERHDRADLLAGVDLAGHDDAVAGVLMDLARTETQPRAVRFGQVLSGAIKGEGLRMHRHPVQGADFAVLRSPDIPSALLELGFMSSDIDRARLHDAAWRTQMVAAITAGVQRWAKADAAEARLLRQ
ncbi:N-acetylmuramoyl-L-alanine amidase [Rhodobacter capsulatus]|uniref:N-acetylmuramoyl-L-alanine amidase n=1 Tax=Rhodobacter capsulatus TaxID=1061 RepID=A0A0Q0WMS1_RHOCA|nr:N-acetylmuramoyl-L-alanine amidase [Rhodobacter capsulatus]KQB17230.1 N-acetylmuramoyl-L-alanine amidase [Rhodobacter capsulatus]KQB17630.1 N-acetylmuramoyl-L-alanine amidase [Rhodobacter capsulatus]PZX27385.1 N-acetylmuramoyl-L-alanine amidase [Rhodobacter capsulatus]QNR64465.1 N-acetylmuramoyl-L-alanine amidase [Rhodobacter capsulatus]WER07735.1 N-acetylmuramoyl-L-alanine amidase [Rhodobacter capsulatus]